MSKKILFVLAFALIFLIGLTFGTASATIDGIVYPYNNEIINSATIDLVVNTTGSGQCFYNYNNGHNYSIGCSGQRIRLPKTDGNYTLVVSDDAFSQKSVNVILSQPDGMVIVFFSIAFIIIIIGMVVMMLLAFLKALALQMSVEDLAFNWGAFIGLLAVYLLALEYLGSTAIQSFLLSIIEVGGITNFFIPSILFVVCWFKNRVTGEESDYKK